ncbi:MAG: 50S ribosomal protein L35 [Patescibacteria group bacterium]|nr:50S ribosomal protein L35 [Patescibacteria group bacterium]
MKERDSFLERVKITKKGKILRRISGLSHFLAKKSSKLIRKKRKLKPLIKK